jgi:hypothetical protein
MAGGAHAALPLGCLLLAQILKHKGQPVAPLVVDRIGDEYPAGDQ